MSYGSKTVDTTGSERPYMFQLKCKLCSKVLKLSNMGIEAIKSHESNAKHRDLVAVVVAAAPIQSFLQPSTLSSASGESQLHASSSSTELSITATSAAS